MMILSETTVYFFYLIFQTLTSSIIPEESTTSTADETEFANSGELSASMDIFSAGCVLIELFTEGAVPFNFSQLLAYRYSIFIF